MEKGKNDNDLILFHELGTEQNKGIIFQFHILIQALNSTIANCIPGNTIKAISHSIAFSLS